ncbi:MAG: AI-2E family transporter [Spirochaetaceae bacterium]|jgi:predicted PurR-regulated permease PerM|nr:AI-2E family transporter [Spirochaetaceae bacterium]
MFGFRGPLNRRPPEHPPDRPIRFPRGTFFLMLFMAVIAGLGALKIAASVVVPLVIAVFFATALYPLIVFLNRRVKIPWNLSVTLVITVSFVVLGGFFLLLVSSVRMVFSAYPRYEARFLTVYQTIAGILKLPFNADNSFLSNLWDMAGMRSFIQYSAITFSNGVVAVARNLVVISLLICFLLVEMQALREKLSLAMSGEKSRYITAILEDIMGQVAKYISVKFFISLSTGLLVFSGTMAVKLDFAIIWGFLAFALNFIPNFGSIAAGLFTFTFSILQFWPDPVRPVYVGILMLAVNMILGNIVEPRVQGKNLGISPFLILASLALWGWIWGFAGMVLAVPMMVVVQFICENVSFLRPVAIMMGSVKAAQEKAACGGGGL